MTAMARPVSLLDVDPVELCGVGQVVIRNRNRSACPGNVRQHLPQWVVQAVLEFNQVGGTQFRWKAEGAGSRGKAG